jgi:hypothetical protein
MSIKTELCVHPSYVVPVILMLSERFGGAWFLECTRISFWELFSLMSTSHTLCRNPSLGLATKAKGLQGCGPRGSPGVTSHTPGSVRECEGVNPHTPKATPTLGDRVSMDFQNFIEQF